MKNEIYCDEKGTVLLLTRGLDFEAKKMSNYFALILKSNSSLLFFRWDRIFGNFSPL